jgi:voltage-gated potassium channel
MRTEAGEYRQRVAAAIAEAGRVFSEARRAGRWAEMEEARDQILLLQEDISHVEEQAVRIEEAFQHQYLQERVRERLGSDWRVRGLEAVILILIAAVLGILWVESAYSLTETEQTLLTIADTAICAIFLTEFFWRMRYADSKAWYWRRFWIDFVASLPLAGLLRLGRIARVARAARIARVARAARLVRALRALAFLSRGFDKIAGIFRLQVFSRPLILTVGLLVAGGFAISRMEGAASEDVHGFWQGIWWSFTTVVTGGYGDIHNPQSGWARGLTVLLVILGIILTGALTAGLAEILLGDETASIQRKQTAIQSQLEELSARVERIESILAGAADHAPGQWPPAPQRE